MNFLPALIARALGFLSTASSGNPKATNTISALAVLASAWYGIDASTFARIGKMLCSIGDTLQKIPSF